jgi:hypothetical protein
VLPVIMLMAGMHSVLCRCIDVLLHSVLTIRHGKRQHSVARKPQQHPSDHD